MLWLRLILPFFLCVSPGCVCVCSLRFVVRIMLPCLLWISECGSSPFLFCTSRRFSFFVSGLSQVSSLFHHFVSSGYGFSLYVPSTSSFVGGFFSSASVPPQPVYRSSLSILRSEVVLTRSDLRFPLQRGLWDESGFCCTICSLSCQGGFWWSFPFLSRFPFRSSASFTSKVPLGTWLPFGMSPSSLVLFLFFVFWLFPDVFPFPLLHVAFALLRSLPSSL